MKIIVIYKTVCVCVCEELHVAEGGSDKHLHSTCHVAVEEAQFLLQKTSPKP